MVAGTPYKTWTCDLLLRRQLLYPTELMEHKCHCIVRFTRYMSENSCKLTYPAVFYAMTYGADNRTRTCMLSQWNLNPSCLPIPPYPHLEQVTRIELASSEWKSDVLAIVRHLHEWQLSTSVQRDYDAHLVTELPWGDGSHMTDGAGEGIWTLTLSRTTDFKSVASACSATPACSHSLALTL